MKQISKRVAECGCAVHVHSEIGDEGTVIGMVEIVGHCPDHPRADQELRLDALVGRVDSLKRTVDDVQFIVRTLAR